MKWLAGMARARRDPTSKICRRRASFMKDVPSVADLAIYYLDIPLREYGENSTELMQK